MNDDALRRILREQQEAQRRVLDTLRGPIELFRQQQARVDDLMRPLAGTMAELQRQHEKSERMLEGFRPLLDQMEETRKIITHVDAPLREFLRRQREQDAILKSAIVDQEAIARMTALVRTQWSGLGGDANAWSAALREASAMAASAVDSEADVAAADDDPAAAGLFLSRATGLSKKARAALAAALVETADQLLEAALTLRSDMAVGVAHLAFALMFLAVMLYSLDGD